MSRVTRNQRTRQTQNNAALEPRVLRVAFYERVSSDEQEERGTIESQRSYLHERFAVDFRDDALNRMQLAGEYADDGVSGATPLAERPSGQRLLNDAQAGLFDVVVVYKVDRLGRSARVLIEAHDELEKHGVAITSATEPFDTRPGPMQAIGRFVFQLLASIAELDRATIQSNTMNGKHRVANEGRFVNGTVAFGYDVDDDARMVPSQRFVVEVGCTEAEIIRQIFERIAAGQSLQRVADWLIDAGVASTHRMYNKKSRRLVDVQRDDLLSWSYARVLNTIRNTVYKGVRDMSFGHRSLTQMVPALVSETLWQAANQRVLDRSAWDTGSDEFTYLLTGKLFCTATLADGTPCDMRYTGGLSNGCRYYNCNGHHVHVQRRRGGQRCPSRGLRMEKIEALIWEDIAWQIKHPDDVLAELQRRVNERYSETSVVQQRLQDLRAQRQGLSRGRQQLLLGVDRGVLTIDEAEKQLKSNGQAAAATDEQIANVEASLEVDSLWERRLATIGPVLRALHSELADIEASQDRVAMRRIIDRLVGKIEVLDPRASMPRLRVLYTFRTRPVTTPHPDDQLSVISSASDNLNTDDISVLGNTLTVCVQGDAPESRARAAV